MAIMPDASTDDTVPAAPLPTKTADRLPSGDPIRTAQDRYFEDNPASASYVPKSDRGAPPDLGKMLSSMPAAPKLMDIPKPPQQQHYENPMQAWGAPALFFLALGSMASRKHMSAAMDGAAAYMKGNMQGQKEQIDLGFKNWEAATTYAIEHNRQEVANYKILLDRYRGDPNALLAAVSAMGSAYNNPLIKFMASRGDYEGVVNAVSDIEKRNTHLADSVNMVTAREFVRNYLAMHPNATQEDVNKALSGKGAPSGAPLSAPKAEMTSGQSESGVGTKYISSPFTQEQQDIVTRAGSTPEQFDFHSVMYAYGNTNVTTGYRSYRGNNPATVMRSRAAQYWIDKGMGPQDANAVMAEFSAMKHGANTAASLDARMTSALNRAEQTAQVVKPLADKVGRTRFKDWNDFMVNVRKRTGNEDEIRLGIALETLASNYGSSLGMGNSVLTDFQTKRAQAMLEQGWNQGQIGAAVDQILTELKREEAGTRQGMRRFIGGMMDTMEGGAAGTPSSGGMPSQGDIDAEIRRRGLQ